MTTTPRPHPNWFIEHLLCVLARGLDLLPELLLGLLDGILELVELLADKSELLL